MIINEILTTKYRDTIESKNSMKKIVATLGMALAVFSYSHFSSAQELVSILLTDVIKSQGTGNINLFKDVSARQLEQLRLDNDGQLVFAVDINEAASGTEKASTQAVTVEYVILTIGFEDGSQQVYDATSDWFTETSTLVAGAPGTTRSPYYTLLGESGSSRITSNNTVQGNFDSTLKLAVTETLFSEGGNNAVSATLQVGLLQTNESLGDPEAFYDFSGGFEDLALLNAADASFIDNYGAGYEEAPMLVLTNPPVEVDLMAVDTWNYFPTANTFYLVGYEDLYPAKGDYDFNDLTVAYQVKYGLNVDGDVIAIQGRAYLITRGSAYSHDWRLGIELPANTAGTLSCTTYLPPDYISRGFATSLSQNCSDSNSGAVSGNLDLVVFEDTLNLYRDPAGSLFVNTSSIPGKWNLRYFDGPKSEFRLDLASPTPMSSIMSAPFDPYLHVLNTDRVIHLLEVDPSYQDEDGYPFGMLLTATWKPAIAAYDVGIPYQNFNPFVQSKGVTNTDWYETYLSEFIVDIPTADVWAW
ncbi:MAG: LruC domain-containing protein [Oceanicoccus sp.]